MARLRTPSNVLELNGSYKNHPERRRENEAKATVPLPMEAPVGLDLDAIEREIWRQKAKEARLWLREVDMESFARLCVFTRKWRELKAETPISLLKELRLLEHELGFLPAGRAKLTVHDKPKNSFSDL